MSAAVPTDVRNLIGSHALISVCASPGIASPCRSAWALASLRGLTPQACALRKASVHIPCLDHSFRRRPGRPGPPRRLSVPVREAAPKRALHTGEGHVIRRAGETSRDPRSSDPLSRPREARTRGSSLTRRRYESSRDRLVALLILNSLDLEETRNLWSYTPTLDNNKWTPDVP